MASAEVRGQRLSGAGSETKLRPDRGAPPEQHAAPGISRRVFLSRVSTVALAGYATITGSHSAAAYALGGSTRSTKCARKCHIRTCRGCACGGDWYQCTRSNRCGGGYYNGCISGRDCKRTICYTTC